MQPITFDTPRGNVLIREAKPADLNQFRDLRLNALQDSPTAFSADLQVNTNHPMSFWEGRLKADEYAAIFFAEHDNQLIGMTGIRMGESPKTKHGAGIWGVYVRPAWRGLHIAERFIEACADWAKPRSINILKLGVVTSNTAAVRCYERCGFKIYGTEPRDIFYEGSYFDLYLMYRELE